ncbi:MAG: ABC transporter permease [Oscillospiraceae bacterium]
MRSFGIVSGAIMAFTMSLDDFVISYFVYGPSYVTLPVEIYNYTKKPLQPKIYAPFTLLFALILLLMILMNVLQARAEHKKICNTQVTKNSNTTEVHTMKNILSVPGARSSLLAADWMQTRCHLEPHHRRRYSPPKPPAVRT